MNFHLFQSFNIFLVNQIAYTTHNATHHSDWRGDEGPCCVLNPAKMELIS